jgi:hypothetical protein
MPLNIGPLDPLLRLSLSHVQRQADACASDHRRYHHQSNRFHVKVLSF